MISESEHFKITAKQQHPLLWWFYWKKDLKWWKEYNRIQDQEYKELYKDCEEMDG